MWTRELHTCSIENCFSWVVCSEFENLRLMRFLMFCELNNEGKAVHYPSGASAYCHLLSSYYTWGPGRSVVFKKHLSFCSRHSLVTCFFASEQWEVHFPPTFSPVTSELMWFLSNTESAPRLTSSEQKGCLTFIAQGTPPPPCTANIKGKESYSPRNKKAVLTCVISATSYSEGNLICYTFHWILFGQPELPSVRHGRRSEIPLLFGLPVMDTGSKVY